MYERGLGEFLEDCRAIWKSEYDVVLIDSRTGITDIGGICTVQLPEVLVMLFTANEQSIRGTLDVARRAVATHDAMPYDRAGLMITPIPTRFDAREEYKRARSWQGRFVTDLKPLFDNWVSRDVPIERLLGHLTIPYVSYWSFGEELPAVVEANPGPDKIGYSLESLAALIAHRLDRTDLLAESRDSYVAAAARAGLRENPSGQYDVFISVGKQHYYLAVRIARELEGRSIRVAPLAENAGTQKSSPHMLDTISDSRNLMVLIGDGLTRPQSRDVDRFLRQTLDEGSDRLVIPVLAPGGHLEDLPAILGQFMVERLEDAGDAAIGALVRRVVRASSVGPAQAEAESTVVSRSTILMAGVQLPSLGAER